jgi:hypothetical protein
MPIVFVVLNVGSYRVKLMLCGLTVDRLFIRKTTNASGKNFINVSANQLGGLGATIAHHQNLAIALCGTIMMTI